MSGKLLTYNDIGEITSGFAFPSSNFNDLGNGLPLIRCRDVNSAFGGIYYDGEFDERFIVEDGDLLLSMDGDFKLIEWARGRALLNQRVCRLEPDETKIHKRYLLHFLPQKIDEIHAKTSFATVKHLSAKSVREIEFPVPHKNGKPDLDEQKRIAAILDKADAIRRKRQQALRLTDDFLRSVFLDMFGDPVTNPKGYEVGVIGNLLESVNYGTSKKASVKELEFPVLRMGNITYEGGWKFDDLKYIELDEKEQKKHLVHKGQLLFNRTNSRELVGKTAVYRESEPMAFAGYLIRGIAKEDADAEYVSGYLNSQHGKLTLARMCKNIVGMANINAKELQAIPVLLPPPAQQKAFGDIVRNVTAKRTAWAPLQNESENLFSSLQQRAFRGEL